MLFLVVAVCTRRNLYPAIIQVGKYLSVHIVSCCCFIKFSFYTCYGLWQVSSTAIVLEAAFTTVCLFARSTRWLIHWPNWYFIYDCLYLCCIICLFPKYVFLRQTRPRPRAEQSKAEHKSVTQKCSSDLRILYLLFIDSMSRVCVLGHNNGMRRVVIFIYLSTVNFIY